MSHLTASRMLNFRAKWHARGRGQKVTTESATLLVGLGLTTSDVTPDGKLALTADNGNTGPDGNVYTVSVIDGGQPAR